MALPATFLEELRTRTNLAALIGRRVKLARSGRQWKGCCPFHQEKTPSFYVYDNGFHCFGCGAHGDAISFIMQTEGGTFMEAVTRLAAEAGLDIPQPTPEAAAAERRRHDIFAVLAAAEALFRASLHAPEGTSGLAYLRGRDLSDETIQQFGLGWAPSGRSFLAALHAQGIEPAQAAEAGLVTQSAAGPRAFFHERVTFPIRDQRGRTIGFGARTLGDGQPKYLNGPETPVFRKRLCLYGLDRAREGIRQGAPAVVVEGYMDVIRLHQAGLTGAVAPLGTALSPEHLQALWALAPLPTLCFDGDAAGGRAAARSVLVALPHLTPERSLRVALLPPGDDPDSLVRTRGPSALRAVLNGAASLADTLFAHAIEAAPGDGPEARARRRRRLLEAAARIEDRVLAAEMRAALLDRFFAARARRGAKPAPAPKRSPPAAPLPERLRHLTALLLYHPALLPDVEEAFALVPLPPVLDRVRAALREWLAAGHALDSRELITHLRAIGLSDGLEAALAGSPLPCPPVDEAQPAEAEARWWHFFNLLDLGGLDAQVERARRDFQQNATPETQNRLVALCKARTRLHTGDDTSAPEA